jgi:CopG family transcriptional regulator / antitoxin EndoAI
MHLRLNIILPEETVRLINRLAGKRYRSRFIDRAVKRYVEEVGRANLRKSLKEGAILGAERDLRLAEEWFAAEGEAWDKAAG